MVSPTTWAKTIAIQMAPLGQKKMFGPQTIERLERVSCRVREIAARDEWYLTVFHATRPPFQTQLSEEILGLPNLEDLGVKPQYVKDKMPFELLYHRAYAHYRPESVEEEPPIVDDPVPLTRAEERTMVMMNREPFYKALLPI